MVGAINLTALAMLLAGKTKFKRLQAAIERFHGTRSIEIDLMAASEAIETLRSISGDGDQRRKFGAALTSHAVMLYYRGFAEASGRRFKLEEKMLPLENREAHRRIAGLRHTVIAHFGVKETDHAKRWIDEKLILRTRIDGTEDFPFLPKRANFLDGAIVDLVALLDAAIPLVREMQKPKLLDMYNQFDVFGDDAELAALVTKCAFDPLEYYPVPAMAQAFWISKIPPTFESYQAPSNHKR